MYIEGTLSADEVKELLLSCELPAEDIDAQSTAIFFGAIEADSLVGVAGVEIYGVIGLLRSLAVIPEFRKNGIGAELVKTIEAFALGQGVHKLYLLTTTAERYFLKRGYNRIPRSDAPESIQSTSQFTELCY